MSELPTASENHGGSPSPLIGGPVVSDMSTVRSRELLQTYSRILTELIGRGIIRSRNAPVGDLAEYLVALAYKGSLAPKSAKSWDVLAADERRIQVKSRLVSEANRTTQQYSPFRSWDFDACVFVNFDSETYEVTTALEVPTEGIKTLASHVPHVGATAFRVNTKSPLATLPGAKDVSALLQASASDLDRLPSS